MTTCSRQARVADNINVRRTLRMVDCGSRAPAERPIRPCQPREDRHRDPNVLDARSQVSDRPKEAAQEVLVRRDLPVDDRVDFMRVRLNAQIRDDMTQEESFGYASHGLLWCQSTPGCHRDTRP